MYPFTCARTVRAAPTATLSRAEDRSQEEAGAQDGQGNAKAENTKSIRAKQAPPARALPGQLARCQRSEPPLSPRVPTNYVGTRAREAPPWWHADLCQHHKPPRSYEDQKLATLGGILAEEIHKTPGKCLAGDDCTTTARPLPGPRQGPCRGRQRGYRQARVGQDSTAIPKQLRAQPAGQAPAWR